MSGSESQSSTVRAKSCSALEDLYAEDQAQAQKANLARFEAAARLVEMDDANDLTVRRLSSVESLRSSTESPRRPPARSPLPVVFSKAEELRAEQMLNASRSPPVSEQEKARRDSNEAYKSHVASRLGDSAEKQREKMKLGERAETILKGDPRGKSQEPLRPLRPAPKAAFSPIFQRRAEALLRNS